MGEPTCLMRSFSHPSSASRENKEGDPFRALTESISFGRFMSESLAWEKWSTFSHNRYLEEVEQFSKPGSVAQKKAFFEAHYKKRAAMKAQALLEQPNGSTNNTILEQEIAVSEVPETETTANSSVPQEETTVDSDSVIDKVEGNRVIEPADSSNVNNMDIENASLQDVIVEDVVQEKEEVNNIIRAEDSELLNDCGKIEAPLEKQKPVEESAEKENVASQKNNSGLPVNKRQMNSSLKSSNQNRASKIPKSSTRNSSSAQLNGGTKVKLKSKSSSGDTYKSPTPKSVHMSINFSHHSGLTGKGSIRMSKECSTPSKISSRESVCGISKLSPSVSRQPDEKRYRSLVNKSVSGGTTTVGVLQARSGDRDKSDESKPRSPIVSSPFRFRSEQRVAKRREFFQKLEERNNSKTQTQVKSKVPLTRPRSPKLGRKESESRLSQRPSVIAERSKCFIPKSSIGTTRSVTSLPRKKAHENASPNIQL